jgi:hypothetical protein
LAIFAAIRRASSHAPIVFIVLLLAGYYNGKRNNTIIEPQTIKKEEALVGRCLVIVVELGADRGEYREGARWRYVARVAGLVTRATMTP